MIPAWRAQLDQSANSLRFATWWTAKLRRGPASPPFSCHAAAGTDASSRRGLGPPRPLRRAFRAIKKQKQNENRRPQAPPGPRPLVHSQRASRQSSTDSADFLCLWSP
ncbi:hypothetical protein VTN96DRAFT_7233 [Rasamsonia emersonii]